MNLLFTFTQDSMANDQDYVDIGLSCAGICEALGRGMNRKRLSDLSPSVHEVIKSVGDVGRTSSSCFRWLTDRTITRRTVAGIQRKVVKNSQRSPISRLTRARNDTIATWRSELNRILHVFNVL